MLNLIHKLMVMKRKAGLALLMSLSVLYTPLFIGTGNRKVVRNLSSSVEKGNIIKEEVISLAKEVNRCTSKIQHASKIF